MKKEKTLPRGLRNNNPLNIRIGNVWLGEVAHPTDLEFEQFVHVKYGLRAAFVILRRYINRYQRRTITDIISAWAPASENDTQRYIDTVSKLSEVPVDEVLSFDDSAKLCAIVDAMVFVENGQHLDRKIIEESYKLA